MKKPLLVSLICLVASAALLIWGFQSPGPVAEATPYHYVLIIENDTGSFLMQLRKGMQKAASMHNASFSVENALSNAPAQAGELATRGVSAVFLLLEKPGPLLESLALLKLPAIVIGQTVPGKTCVATDDAAAGAMLLERALSMASPSQVLVLTDETDPRSPARLAGMMEQNRSTIVTVLPWPQPLQTLARYPVWVATSGNLTHLLGMGRADGSLPAGSQVVGIDTGGDRVSDLEEGRVQGMIMDNPYTMGYLAMDIAPEVSNASMQPAFHPCDVTLIDLSNMYLIQNVKLVFPLLQ